MSSSSTASTMVEYEVFEFFAGIGGFHLSLPPSLPIHSITAIEIDRRAAECYQFNLHPQREEVEVKNTVANGNEKTINSSADANSNCATSNSPTAATTAAASARSRMKANRKIFFQKQKEEEERKRIEAEGKAATESSNVTQDDCKEDEANESVTANTTAPAAPRRLIASTTIGAFNFPPPSNGGRQLIHSSQPPRLLLRLIEQLSSDQLVSSAPELRPSIWCMSPPCQPYTHTKDSKQLGSRDPRNAAFHFLMRILTELSHTKRPQWIFLENVKHFYASDMHEVFITTLQQCGYKYTQYLLSPMQIGIPNHRTRFYAAAEKLTEAQLTAMSPEQWHDLRKELIVLPPGFATPSAIPANSSDLLVSAEEVDDTAAPSSISTKSDSSSPPILPTPASLPVVIPPSTLVSYLDPPSFQSPTLLSTLTLPANLLSRPFHLSVVNPYDRRTFCFTGGYGKVIHTSSGSFLLFQGNSVTSGQSLTEHPLDKSEGWTPYISSIRFFSPMELLRLFGFPDWYRFPSHFTSQQCYKLIGNSINVSVVTCILQHHLQS